MTAGYMGAAGRVGVDAENIVIPTVDRGDVTAGIDHGWFAAWWPSPVEPTSLTVTTTTGTYDLAP